MSDIKQLVADYVLAVVQSYHDFNLPPEDAHVALYTAIDAQQARIAELEAQLTKKTPKGITDRQVSTMMHNLAISFGIATKEDIVRLMVDRFLSWKLPKEFSPDAGISFTPTKPYEGDELGNSWWPVGTNLFTADQALEMVRYLLCIKSIPPQIPDGYVLVQEGLHDELQGILEDIRLGVEFDDTCIHTIERVISGLTGGTKVG